MSTLVRKNNDWLNALFNDFMGDEMVDSRVVNKAHSPAVNIKENDDQFTLEVLAPGFKKEDIEVHIDENVLSVSSETEHDNTEESDGYHKREFVKRSFKRSFKLPETVNEESIEAVFEDGILNIHLPKLEEAKPKPARTIKIA